MKLGFCGSVEKAAEIREWGYDYIELALAPLAQLPEAEFTKALETLLQSGLPCLACNVFLPGSIPVVGHQVDPEACRRYAETALSRAEALGARVVVFGSGSSRNVPGGYPGRLALAQLQAFAAMAAEVAKSYHLTLVLEPLNSIECNIINRVSEALILVQAVNHPNFKVLADTYHMQVEREDLTVLSFVGEDLGHVHVANRFGRKMPLAADAAQQANLFAFLRAINYQGNISIEAGFRSDQAAEARESLAVFRQQIQGGLK